MHPSRLQTRLTVAAIRRDSRIVDMTDALDEVHESVMIDPVHTNEIGNQVIAERIFRALSPLIEQAAKAKQVSTP